MRHTTQIDLICDAWSSVMYRVAAKHVESNTPLRLYPQTDASMPQKTTSRNAQERVRRAQMDWLEQARAKTGMTLTEIARMAGLHPGSLNRFLNDEKRGGVLQVQSIAAVAQALGLRTSPALLGTGTDVRAGGFSESEATLWQAEGPSDPVAAAVTAMTGHALNLVPWELKSQALLHDGYRPGDILIVDLNASPKPGEIVLVQLYDWHNRAGTQTAFRLYEPPYLIASGPVEAAKKPRLIDTDEIGIKGVVQAMLRRK